MPTLTPQQKILFEQLSKDRQQNAKVLEKLSMKGIKNSFIEKYSDQAHFIYELLQNADDVKATQVRFLLKKTGLIFAHNGSIHFYLTDPNSEAQDSQKKRLGHINAITSIGNSNKYEAQIGKFGVGFKAVFQYTNTPEIYDPPFLFRIERFIVPFLISSDHPNRQAEETLFYFPFDNASQSPTQAFRAILTKLKNLTNPLLFLRHLTQMTWYSSEGSQGQYTKAVKPIDDRIAQTTTRSKCSKAKALDSKCSLDSKCHTQHFLVFTGKINAAKMHSFSIAYRTRQSEKGQATQILYDQIFPAYCFFPTKETTPLRFIVQAPFLLTDSREGIKHGEQWNKQLIQALAKLTAESLSTIKSLSMLTEDFFNVLPINDADFPAEHLFRPIYDAVLTQLQSYNALLPTIKAGNYTTRDKAYLAENPALMNLLTSEQLSHLLKNENAVWVFPQTTYHHRLLWNYVKHYLINQEVNSDQLARRITKAFIQLQTDEWLIKLYTYLLEKARYLWNSKNDLLKTKPILRLTDGKIVSAYNRAGKIQVYLPTEQKSEYPTLKGCFVKHEKSLQFLQALGIDKPKEYEEIKYYILPRYQQKGEIAPAIMQRDFRKLFTYFLNCSWHQKADYLNQLKKIAFCRARYFADIADNTIARLYPQQIYFKTDKLENYFSHYPNIYFLDSAFYNFKVYDKAPLNQFFKELGVADKPKRIKIKPNLSAQQRYAIHQGECTQDYYHFFQYSYDYDIEGLDAFIADHINLEKSKMLWHFLLKLIEEADGADGQDIFKGQYNWFYRRERYYYFDAKFLITLRQSAWLYNSNSNSNGNPVKPAEVIVPELAAHYDTHHDAAKTLIEKLEIQSARLSGFTDEQQHKYVFGDELFKLAVAAGKEPSEVLNKLRHFLTQAEHKKPKISTPPDGNSVSSKRALLEKQLAQKMDAITQIEALQSHLIEIEKYSVEWFNTLLELEYLLSEGEGKERTRLGKKMSIKFSKVAPDGASDRIIILKNPSRSIPHTIEDIADLSLQLRFGTKTKNLLIDVVSIKDFTLRARLKSAADIQKIDFKKVQSGVIDIKNPTFILEHLKALFRQLPIADDDNLQANLTPQIEFIFGPPGTGKTTYLAIKKIMPLMRENLNLKVLVLTPTNKVADVLVRKIMHEISPKCPNWLIRFGVTGDNEIESAGLLKEKTFDIMHMKKCVLVTTIARFLYDGFSGCKLKAYDWDIIIFDEASMIMLAQITYVLYQQADCQFLIGGDPFQIQPVVIADAWKEENIYTLVGLNSFQSPKTCPHDFPMTNLRTQYRSIPPLGTLFGQFTYNGILNHHRKFEDQKPIKIDGLDLKAITLIKFPISQFDSIYRSQRLDGGGAYHIYAAIFTVELALYLSKQIAKHSQSLRWKIGIVCPYMAQATLVEKMIIALFSSSQVEIVTGTVHRFQGDEFDIILNLLNAPPQISSNIFLNKQNILNVAISRAKDYLILIIPDIGGLDKIKRLETILKGDDFRAYFQEFTSAEVEKIMFKQANYIYENSFITTHQKMNVYAKPVKKYEVRCDENAVDVQLDVGTFV